MTVRYGKWFAAGNIVEGNDAVTQDNWNGGIQFKAGGTEENPDYEAGDVTKKLIERVRVDEPFPMAAIQTQSAKTARELVFANAGSTLPKRDSVDERAVREASTGKVDFEKGIITDVAQVGGYPEYKGEPFKDVGADGIPASWKKKFGLDANDASLAQKDLQGDGYTVIEKYLYGLDPGKKIGW
jgi:hypothetical protein